MAKQFLNRVTFLLTFILACASVNQSAAQCTYYETNNIYLYDNAQVYSLAASMPPGCTKLSNLTIGGTVTDLSPLNSITQIGSLHIQANAPLSGLNGVTNVQGGIFIYSPFSGLNSVVGVNNSDIWIVAPFSGLNSLLSCNNMRFVGDISVTGFAQLQNASGISIEQGVVNIPSFSNLASAGHIWIGQTNLSSISAFSNTACNQITIWSNPNLISISGFNNPAPTEWVHISYNPALETISGFGMTAITDLTNGLFVSNNSGLTTLNAFSNLQSAGAIAINYNPLLQSLASFSNLVSVDGMIAIESNDALVSLAGLQNLTTAKDLRIVSNAQLNDISAFSSMTSLSEDGTGYLYVSGNPVLTSLSGLDNIDPESMQSVYINSSEQLSFCSIPSICGFIANGGWATLSGNAPGCNTVTQIQVGCGIPQNCSNIIISSQADVDNYPFNHGCSTVLGYLQISGADITNLDGLSQLIAVDDLQIVNVPNLTDYSGLNNLTSVTGHVSIGGSTATHLDNVLTSLVSAGSLALSGGQLESISGFDSLVTIAQYFSMSHLPALTAINGFGNLSSIGGNFTLYNTAISSLPHFNSLSIVGDISIGNNATLTSLAGFDSLSSINGMLGISDNPALVSLAGLQNLTTAKDLRILGNPLLTSLSGLDNIDPESMQSVYIYSSEQLSFCSIPSICGFIANGGLPVLSGNAPGCQTNDQISATCNLVTDSDGDGIADNLDCAPNDNQAFHTAVLFIDDDGDGYDAGATAICYGSAIPNGYSATSSGADCDDSNAAIHPGATEIGYNGIDDDCDGSIDEGFPPKITQMQTAFCNTALATIDTQIYANIVAGAQGYRWRVTTMSGPNTGEVQELDTLLRAMKLTQLTNYAFGTQYMIEVAVYYAGYLQAYSTIGCTVTTPEAFTSLMVCDQTATPVSAPVYANVVPFARGYRFRVTDQMDAANTQVLERTLREFRMNQITDFAVQYNKTYNVEVSVKNTDNTWMPYGAMCSVTTPPFPTTSIQDSQCDDFEVPANNTQIYAMSYPGAIAYVFELSGPGLASPVEVTKPLRVFTLNDYAGQLIPGATYNVRVRLVFNLSDPAGSHGKTCTIIAPGVSRNAIAKREFDAIAYPNPFADAFDIEITTASDTDVNVKVYDMVGRQLENTVTKAGEPIHIGSNYPSGVYNVLVTQGEDSKTIRVIKR